MDGWTYIYTIKLVIKCMHLYHKLCYVVIIQSYQCIYILIVWWILVLRINSSSEGRQKNGSRLEKFCFCLKPVWEIQSQPYVPFLEFLKLSKRVLVSPHKLLVTSWDDQYYQTCLLSNEEGHQRWDFDNTPSLILGQK